MKKLLFIVLVILFLVIMNQSKVYASPVVLARVKDYDALTSHWSLLFGLPVSLMQAIICVESGGNAQAVSSVGALGLTQVMPSTLPDINSMLGKQYTPIDLYTPDVSIECGARYLSWLLATLGSESLAIRAYNAGPGNVEENPNASQGYLDSVQAYKSLIESGNA